MSSKKHQRLLKKKHYLETYFKEEYLVHFTNGKVIEVLVDVEYGVNEKRNHLEAGVIANNLYPNLEILKIEYC